MSNVAITALPAATTAQLTDVFPFVLLSGPTTSKITLANLKASLVLVKGDVGLGNVDNTSDASKPVSTAQATAIALKSPLAGSSSIVTVGALTGGSTGAGFTIALSVATVTGTLPDAAFPAVLPGANAANLVGYQAANLSGIASSIASFLALTNPGSPAYLQFDGGGSVTLLSAPGFRAAIGAGTSDFDGAYSSLTGAPTLFDPANPGNIGTGTPGTVAATLVSSPVYRAASGDLILRSSASVDMLTIPGSGSDAIFAAGFRVGGGISGGMYTGALAGDLYFNQGRQILYANGDIESGVTGAGVILKSPDATRYRATMANGGTWSIAPA